MHPKAGTFLTIRYLAPFMCTQRSWRQQQPESQPKKKKRQKKNDDISKKISNEMETKHIPRLLTESVDTDSTDATAATIARPLHDTYYPGLPSSLFLPRALLG
jgi:hypothetical protein